MDHVCAWSLGFALKVTKRLTAHHALLGIPKVLNLKPLSPLDDGVLWDLVC